MFDTRLRGPRASRGGVTRAAAILLALIAVMLVIIAMPSFRVFEYRSEKMACEQAMKSARDGLIIEYLSNWKAGTVEEAMVTLDQVMPARPNICPSGGTVYLLRGDNGIYEPVCGLHNDDKKLRVRLNASRARELLAQGLREQRWALRTEPESVEINLNGKSLECKRVQQEQYISRGTATTSGFEGTVCLYGIAGDGDFTVSKNARKGEICYFVYADENHCALWRASDGWTGDAYQY